MNNRFFNCNSLVYSWFISNFYLTLFAFATAQIQTRQSNEITKNRIAGRKKNDSLIKHLHSLQQRVNVCDIVFLIVVVFYKTTVRNFISQNKNTHSSRVYYTLVDVMNIIFINYIGSETVNFCLMNQSVYGNRRVRSLFIISFSFEFVLIMWVIQSAVNVLLILLIVQNYE